MSGHWELVKLSKNITNSRNKNIYISKTRSKSLYWDWDSRSSKQRAPFNMAVKMTYVPILVIICIIKSGKSFFKLQYQLNSRRQYHLAYFQNYTVVFQNSRQTYQAKITVLAMIWKCFFTFKYQFLNGNSKNHHHVALLLSSEFLVRLICLDVFILSVFCSGNKLIWRTTKKDG